VYINTVNKLAKYMRIYRRSAYMHQLNLAVKDVSFRKVSVSDIISRRLGIFL